MQPKFRVLRIVATLFKILAWIVLVLGLLGSCGALASGLMPAVQGGGRGDMIGLAAGIGGAIGALVGTLIAFVVFYAYGDLISLLISLEENTRLTAERLAGLPGTSLATEKS